MQKNSSLNFNEETHVKKVHAESGNITCLMSILSACILSGIHSTSFFTAFAFHSLLYSPNVMIKDATFA